MGKSAWNKFPYSDKAFTYAGAALKKNWARLHRGDCEPFPADSAAQDAWRAYHAGEFGKAFEIGLKDGPSGINAANRQLRSASLISSSLIATPSSLRSIVETLAIPGFDLRVLKKAVLHTRLSKTSAKGTPRSAVKPGGLFS